MTVTRVAGLLSVLVLMGLVVACDKGRTLRIENHTAEHVQVIESGIPTRTMAPGDVLDLTTLEFSGPRTIEVARLCEAACPSPRVLGEITLTWDDYKRHPVLVVPEQ